MVLVPALLMVSTIRFRSFKTIELQTRRPYSVLILIAGAIMLIATHVQIALVVMAYTYLASAFIGLAVSRIRQRGERDPEHRHEDNPKQGNDEGMSPPFRDTAAG